MARCDLTNFEWSVIEPLLLKKNYGALRIDEGWVVNGISWKCSLFPLTAFGSASRASAGAALAPGHDYALVASKCFFSVPIKILR